MGKMERDAAESTQRYCGPGDNSVIRAACEDYRAGTTHDLKADLPLLELAEVVSAFSPHGAVLDPPAPEHERCEHLDEAGGAEGKVRHGSVGDEHTGQFLLREQ
ncbi:hypothetical protein CALVIDRAFT_542862 [Calocera viscosa TUFC12733]|uniref:Uncharacterized protein n=1 Tax=Calocera viscosa (strain TUFC12733) TaxID=1330018 RepID=A0A167G725_CALVF|nr:hypothetical protein CALVIDRAFT_542862 [Calocera viscosa TUFC12733]